jgi:transcriptional regulator with XRE-family HTH domain
MTTAAAAMNIGDLLREWRQRRRMSQLELALEAEVSSRHLSFIETGRAQPSREMVLRLAEHLDVPLRERNGLLIAAGFAPAYPERPLADPALDAARRAVELVLAGHEPYPALAVDRHWSLIAANRAVAPLLAFVTEPALLAPPINVLRLSLHPGGLAPRVANLGQWRAHLLHRLRQQIDASADPVLSELLRELSALPAPRGAAAAEHGGAGDYGGIAVPLRLVTDGGTLSLFSTTAVFGSAVDVTLSEVAVESFFPADPETAVALRALSEGREGVG